MTHCLRHVWEWFEESQMLARVCEEFGPHYWWEINWHFWGPLISAVSIGLAIPAVAFSVVGLKLALDDARNKETRLKT